MRTMQELRESSSLVDLRFTNDLKRQVLGFFRFTRKQQMHNIFSFILFWSITFLFYNLHRTIHFVLRALY